MGAEGQAELLPLLATLAQDSAFLQLHGQGGRPLQFTDHERSDARALGLAVLQAMLQRAQGLRDDERAQMRRAGYTLEPRGGGAVLVILDNVDEPDLLSQRQLVQLPELNQARERIRFLATSRIGHDQLTADAVQVLELGRLSQEEAHALMQQHRGGADYPDAAYAAAVDRLVRLLDGYTLAVEQVAAYLGLNPGVRAEALLQAFEQRGLVVGDTLLQQDARLGGHILHPGQLFDVVLEQTLRSLDGLPLARSALEFAAFLPPDHVPWRWLEQLVRQRHADMFESVEPWMPDPWQRAQQRLRAAQLLADAGDGVARMHRVIGDHLRLRMQAGVAAAIDAHAETLGMQLASGFAHSPIRWLAELATLRALAVYWQRGRRTDGIAGRLAVRIAGIDRDEGDLAQALALAEYGLRTLEALLEANRGSRETARDVSIGLNKLADLLRARGHGGDTERALALLERSLEIGEALFEANSGSAEGARDISISLNKLADLLRARSHGGDAERALRLLERSLEIREALLEANPVSARAARDVSFSLDRLADRMHARGQDGNAERALVLLERGLEIREALLKADPVSAQAARDVSISLNKIADLLRARGHGLDAERALALLERGLEIREALLKANPVSAQAARDVSISLEKLADLLHAREKGGDAERTLALLERSLQIREVLLKANPVSAQAARDVSISLEKLADLLRARDQGGDAERALALLERSLEIRETLLEVNPASAKAARDVSFSLGTLADLLRARGQGSDGERALALLERSLEIGETLLDANPGSAHAVRDVVVSLERLA